MIYLSRTHRELTEKYIKFAQKGIPNSKILDYDKIIKLDDAKEVWLFGILRGTNLVYEHCAKNKINFYYMDRPYWGNSRQEPYFLRIVKNGHVKNQLEERPKDRFESTFPFDIRPYHRSGKKILVCPPTSSISTFFKCENWLEQTIQKLKNNTDREIIVRDKPYNPEAYIDSNGEMRTGENNTSVSKEKIDWREIHAVVTFNSSITIKALANGVPVFTDENNCAYPIAESDITKIESPRYEDPRPLFYSLAYGQFTAKEMSDGTARRLINGR